MSSGGRSFFSDSTVNSIEARSHNVAICCVTELRSRRGDVTGSVEEEAADGAMIITCIEVSWSPSPVGESFRLASNMKLCSCIFTVQQLKTPGYVVAIRQNAGTDRSKTRQEWVHKQQVCHKCTLS